MLLMEAFGRGLVLEPYFATVILGGGLVASLGSDDAEEGDPERRCTAGTRLLAFAHVERSSRYNLADVNDNRKGGWRRIRP